MPDMPQVRPRDMTSGLQKLVETHKQVHAGIRRHAEAHEKTLAERDQQLNASARLDGRTR